MELFFWGFITALLIVSIILHLVAIGIDIGIDRGKEK